MTWFLKKSSGVEYGPTDLETLRAWAADGRIAPDDTVSRDRALWTPAPDEVLLEIEWMLSAGDDDAAGPFHRSSFAEWLRDGTLSPDARVRNVRTGRRAELRELFPAAEAPAAAPAADAGAAPAIPGRVTWQEMARERDAMEDEARKWRQLHEQEGEAARRREAELTGRVRALEQDLIGQQAAAERAQQEAAAYRREIEAVAGTGASGDWSVAYHALARAHHALTNELEAKLRELRAQREESARIGASAEERVRQADAQATAERRSADEARRALSELEQSHLEVIRSLRELNDRYVRLRERYAVAIAAEPAAGPGAAPAAAPAGPAPAPGAPPAPSGPRIRLMR